MVEELEIVEPKKRSLKKVITFFVFLLLFVAIAFFGYKAYSLTKKVIVNRNGGGSPYLTGDLDSWIKGDGLEKLAVGDRRINILLLGVGGENHPGGNLTDTIMVASIDPKNKEVAMLSIPRDLYVKVKGYGSTKINAVMSIDDGEVKNGEKNYELIKGTVSDFLGVPIHYFALVNFDGFKKIIDIAGGVDIDVKKDLYDPMYPDENVLGYDPFYVEAGQRHFDGDEALKYARSRETTSDFDRARRQQEVIVAVKEKLTQKENMLSPKKISQVMSVLADNLKTDLQLGELEALAGLAKEIKSENIHQKVLDDSADGPLYSDRYDEMYVLVPKDSTLKGVHLFVSQYFKDPFLADENAKIVITNGTKSEYLKNKIVQDIEDAGFNISDSSTKDSKEFKKTFIYDYTNGKKKGTSGFLKEYFGNSVEIISLDSKENKEGVADFEIILGSDYQYSNK